MIRILGLAAALAAGAAAPLPHSPAPAAAQQDFRWSGRLARGEQITVRGIIGDIRAEPASGDEVTVTAVRRGRNADRVRIEVVRRSEGVVICTVYPRDADDDNGRWRRDDEDDDDGRREPRDACNQRNGSTRGEAARVDFTVRVPAGVRVSLASVTGDVYASGLHSPVRAASVSGSVHVSSDGPVQATSVSGDVEATMGRTGSESLHFNTVSGNVTLRVPASTDADFSARTLSGTIESDFPLEVGSRRGRRDDDDDDDDRGGRIRVHVGQEAHGRLGRGGAELRVNTVSGDISLVRISR
jgi:Putative adhesin